MVVKHNYTGHRKDIATLEGYWRVWKAMDIFPRKILELGVDQGGSLLLWNDMFAPISVTGMDIDISNNFLQKIDATFDAIHIQQFDQSQPHTLLDMPQHLNFDLIIDDCSHDIDNSFKCFDHLWGRLNPGGAYVIEDWKAYDMEQSETKLHKMLNLLDMPGLQVGSTLVTHALLGLVKDVR